MFHAYEVSVAIVRELRSVVMVLREHDRELAVQLQRAADSICLNIAEGQYRAAGDRRRCYEVAAGSANEVGAALDLAEAWQWPVEVETCRGLLDRLKGLLWGLTRGKRAVSTRARGRARRTG